VEKRDDRSGAGGRKRKSSENPPQAHMAELKHSYAGMKQKIFSVEMLSVTRSLFFFGDIVNLLLWFILTHNSSSSRNADSKKQGRLRSSSLGPQCHGQCSDGAL